MTSATVIPFAAKLATDLIIGAIIRQGTSGNTTKQAVRAATAIAVLNGLNQVATGDVTDGLASLDSAISATKDPATAAAIQTGVTWIANRAASLSGVLGSSLTGAGIENLITGTIQEAITVAGKYATTTQAAPLSTVAAVAANAQAAVAQTGPAVATAVHA